MVDLRKYRLATVILLIGLLIGIVSCVVLCGKGELTRPSVAVTEEGVPVPILMYHSIQNDSKKLGTYVISSEDFEKDLQYLQNSGYQTVTMTELIDYVTQGVPLPEKPIVLSFDDGYYNNYFYAYPLLQKYQMKAVLSIIGYYTDQYSSVEDNHIGYSHCTWNQLREMMASGLVEIQNHTYHLHTYDKKRKGCAKNQGESLEAFSAILSSDVYYLQDRIKEELNYEPNTFTYPFGSYNKDTCKLIRQMGFSASLSCESGISRVRVGDGESLYLMKRFLRTHKKTAEEYLHG